MYLLIVFLSLLGSSVAGFFGRFLGSEGTAIMKAPYFLMSLFFCVVALIVVYRIVLVKVNKKKKSDFLLTMFYFSIIFFFSLFFGTVRLHFDYYKVLLMSGFSVMCSGWLWAELPLPGHELPILFLGSPDKEAPYQGQPDAPSSGPEAPSAGVDKASGSGAPSEALEGAKGKRPLEVSPDDCKEVEGGKRIHPSAPSGSEQGQAVREPAGVQGQPPMADPLLLFLLKHQDNELARQLLQLHKEEERIRFLSEAGQSAEVQKGRTDDPEGE